MTNRFLKKALYFLFLIPALLFIAKTTSVTGEERQGVNEGYITITDCQNRKVNLPEKIERIACLYAFTGHAVTMLGRGGDMVAVSNGLKRDSLLHEICPSINDAMVPKAQGALNMEELLKAAPDVLFIPGDMSGNRGEMEKLNRFGIPTIIIDYYDISGQQKAIAVIGEAIGRKHRAEEYNNYYNNIIKRVKETTDTIEENNKLRLYYSVNEATRTSLREGLSTDWLGVTGVINVALQSSIHILEGKNFVGMEQILMWNPDVILANEPESLQLITSNRKWAAINALKNKKVYQMPIAISRWGHPGSIETPLAILWTVKKLYPSLFSDIDMEKETRNYYKIFFNHDLSKAKVKAILEGGLTRNPKHAPGENKNK